MKKLILSKIHQKLRDKDGRFCSGYYMPVQYSLGVKEEHRIVREEVGVFDVSHMGEIFVCGENSLNFYKDTSNDVSKLTPGKGSIHLSSK